ncbi:hypothetical protein GA0111570_109100 [Raineyella antarctica]|uniref:Uncharacterized protein n=1 Tax=Raineyella antarctica TaxID=1577474 RepID=A0A1G6HFW6_9ACTN|nr:hypothetical protein GA0111570_109100 [Raineyella antarctica]
MAPCMVPTMRPLAMAVRDDPGTTELDRLRAPHVFGNLKVRPVRVRR